MCAQAGGEWPLTLMHEPQTLAYKLPLPSPGPRPPDARAAKKNGNGS